MIEDNSFSMDTVVRLAHKRRFPYRVTMELLTACNYHCKHCYLPEHNNFGLKYVDIISILAQLREMGTLSLILTGGEIFLRNDIMNIIREARNMGFSVTLLSNASVLSKEVIRELANLHINSFSTTIFSLNEEVNDKITCVYHSLKNILNNVRQLSEYGIRVEIKTPLMEDNKFAYRELIPYCKARGYTYVPSTVITSKINGDMENTSLRIKNEDLKVIFNEIDFLLQREDYNNEAFYESALPCPSIRYSMYIDCMGNVYPCNSFYYKVGNVLESTVKYIWEESEAYKKLNGITNADLKQCIACELKNYCTRCPGHALQEDGNLLGCSSLDKKYAELAAEKRNRVGANDEKQ